MDTVSVGSNLETAVVCAALGVYCGKDFGWNIFTRKTTHRGGGLVAGDDGDKER